MTKFLSGTKLYELAGVTSLITWLGVGILGSFLRISQMLDSRAEVIAIFAQCATALFLSMVVILLVIRLPPVRKAKGALPKLAGTLGCLLPILVLALPRASLTYSMAIFSSALVLAGTVGSILSVCWLGRSFSIFPQARGLVTQGPYRLIRHPLYLAELCVVLGRVCELDQSWPFIVMVTAIAIQSWRMHYEEQILLEEFPSYREYASRTARLVPGLYLKALIPTVPRADS